MRRVSLVEGLKVREVMLASGQEIRMVHTRREATRMAAAGPDEFLEVPVEFVERIVPVHEFAKRDPRTHETDRWYLAWTQEIQDQLGMPFDVLRRENEAARHEAQVARRKVQRWADLTFLGRLRFLITKELPRS